MHTKSPYSIAAMVVVAFLPACAAKISGTVQLVDADVRPLTQEAPQGTVVNMINVTAPVDQSSRVVTTDVEGKFESVKDSLSPGTYKVEASRIGFATETQTVEIGKYTRKKIEFKLRKIDEGKRKTIAGSTSDEDKIINPGEVNIQPPPM